MKRVVITGASRGLGCALVERWASEHVVVGCATNAEKVADLSRRYGKPHDFAVVDVADSLAVSAWAKHVLAEGVPDLLINNAAIINRNAPLWEIDVAEFDRVIDVNIKGVANVIRAFAPAMIARKSGVIVNLSSGWGRSTAPEVAPYCATKYAIEGLTKAFAQELPPGLAAVALNPGVIATDMLMSCFGASASDYPTAEQWAKKAALFILNITAKDNGKSLTVG